MTYDVYFGTDPSLDSNELVSINQSETTYNLGILNNEITYYWKIVAKDNHGNSTSGTIWQFITGNRPPDAPNNPNPANNATSVPITTNLSWSCKDPEDDPLTYDVYFRTGYWPGPGNLVSINQSETTFDLGTLDNETTYYWKIVAKDDHGNSTNGYVWHFTTNNAETSENMIFVQGGTFQMGDRYTEGDSDEFPLHNVTLSSFYIGETEVTQSEYTALMGNNPAHNYGIGINHPVYYVTWCDAVKYCNKKSITESLTPCYSVNGDTNPNNWGNNFIPDVNWSANGYRLPTEAEWEYAARGGINQGDNNRYSGCNNESDLPNYAWYSESVSLPYGTKEVGTKLPNQLGLYDMSGNVSEWCWDCYGAYSSSPQTNPTGPSSGSCRVLRGGSWVSLAYYCRVAERSCTTSDNSSNFFGFRLVRGIY